jgi:hypothetical protein
MAFPIERPRRLRQSAALRALAREIANGARGPGGVVFFQLLFEADDVAGEGLVPEGLGALLRQGTKSEKS